MRSNASATRLRRRIAISLFATVFALAGAPVGGVQLDKAAAGKPAGPGQKPTAAGKKPGPAGKKPTAGGGTLSTYGRKVRSW
jgi:hypothetical protein